MAENGTAIKIKIGTKEFIGETSNSFSSSQNMINASSKKTGVDSEFVAGRTTRTISVSSLADFSNVTDYGFADAIAAQDAKTAISWTISKYTEAGVLVTAAHIYSGSGLLSDVSQENGDDALSTMSLSIQVSGEVTTAVNPA